MVLKDEMGRVEVAKLLQLHPDSVTRNLHGGLGSAVLVWGGHGKRMIFSRLKVLRWWRAKTCTRETGRPCSACSLVIEDCVAVARHLLAMKHGADEHCGEHEACFPMPAGWDPIRPCAEGVWAPPARMLDGPIDSSAVAIEFGISYFTIAAWIAEGMPVEQEGELVPMVPKPRRKASKRKRTTRRKAPSKRKATKRAGR